jgi:hypothetical protein
VTRRRAPRGTRQPTSYRIVVRSELSARYSRAFEGMTLHSCNGQTAITGPVVDQAQLHGLLDRIRDLGLELVSVSATPEPTTDPSADPTVHPMPPVPGA